MQIVIWKSPKTFGKILRLSGRHTVAQEHERPGKDDRDGIGVEKGLL